jgi:NitT/TauT family transport system permease protein
MAAIASERPVPRSARLRGGGGQLALVLAVALALWGLWEGYRWIWVKTGLTWPFPVNDTTLPHVHTIVQALFVSPQVGGPWLLTTLFHNALFTAKEAAAGFALGAIIGFTLGVVLAHSGILERGFLPYIVASQTIPILAIAPMVVVWVNPRLPDSLANWGAVAVIAAYLTFFPVTINTLRGLQSVDPQALELMRSYAASRWTVLWKLRVPAAMPYLFAALKVAATASVVGAIIGELPSAISGGLGGAIINFAQYYSFQPQNLWATNLIAALLGIAFFLVIVLVERLVVHRPPEELV